MQRCPRNSVEQLGQTEDASFCRFFRFAGPRFAGTPLLISTALGAAAERNALPVELRVGLMSGVVAQIQPRHECEPGAPSGLLDKPTPEVSTVETMGAVPKW